MDAKTIHIVVQSLIGKIQPAGASHIDPERLDNLNQLCELVNLLLADIDGVAFHNRAAHEASIKRAVRTVDEFFQNKIYDQQ